mgnify:CR=1 FL=1
MRALDGKITICIDYRPCIVHIPEQREYFYKNRKREYRVKKSSEDVKALFHCWNHRSELCDASPMLGGHPGGQVSGTFAIVEYEDGTVHEVEPQNIRFVDNAMCEYVFNEGNEESEKYNGTDWHCPICGKGHMKLDEGIVLTSNPPMYRYVCDKCGHIESSRNLIYR